METSSPRSHCCSRRLRSEANVSDGWRRQLYFSYNALSDGGEQREAHYTEFHRWLVKKYAEFDKHDTYFD